MFFHIQTYHRKCNNSLLLLHKQCSPLRGETIILGVPLSNQNQNGPTLDSQI